MRIMLSKRRKAMARLERTVIFQPGRQRLPDALAQDLKSTHVATGLTLSGAARRIGISRSYLAKLLNAEAAPSTRTAERIISAYDLPDPVADELRREAVPQVERHHTRNTLPRDVAAELKSARERSGLTFREAAARAGISHGFLGELCQGRAAPSRAVAERIIEALGIDDDNAHDLLEASV